VPTPVIVATVLFLILGVGLTYFLSRLRIKVEGQPMTYYIGIVVAAVSLGMAILAVLVAIWPEQVRQNVPIALGTMVVCGIIVHLIAKYGGFLFLIPKTWGILRAIARNR